MHDRQDYAKERSHRSWPVVRWAKRARGHRVVEREAARFVLQACRSVIDDRRQTMMQRRPAEDARAS